MANKIVWYQIQLSSRGKLEVFENVFSHKVGVFSDTGTPAIYIRWSRQQNTGLMTHSTRSLEGVYQIRTVEVPLFNPIGSKPKDLDLIVN